MIKVCTPVQSPESLTYNKGIKIYFPPSKNHSALDLDEIDFDFSTYLSGFETTVQSALIDLGTKKGSNKYFPERGNDFEEEAASGFFVETVQLQHSANFMALDTKTFINQNIRNIQMIAPSIIEDADAQAAFEAGTPSIQTLSLTPSLLGPTSVVLQSVFVSSDEEQIGQELTTII